MPLLRRGGEDTPPVITLLTDYGLRDAYAGVLHGVIRRICPAATVIDISHEIPPGDLLAGALALAESVAFMPVGVHVAIVDPGVGTDRRALALRCANGRAFIGPDNGLLAHAVAGAGGVVDAVEISESPWRLEPVSSTFHGRDIFAPVAAEIAGGRPLVAAGDPIEPDVLLELELPAVRVSESAMVATVAAVDHYGNLSLLAAPRDARRAGIKAGAIVTVASDHRRMVARYGKTFGDVGAGRLVLHADSNGRLALSVNGGSAATLLGATSRTELRITR
jgi:S-adenosylmethionine hydrolase